MGVLSVKELVAILLSWISLHTGMTLPEGEPEIVFVPHSQLEAIVCIGKCPVWGYYDPRQIIYLDESLDPGKDVCARSILLHELVHFVQRETDRFSRYENKTGWFLREREARHVQRIFLRQHRYRQPLMRNMVYFESTSGDTTENREDEKIPVAAYAAPRC